MFGRPLCTAAFVFALAVFITLQVFPPQLDPYPELDREEAVLSGTIDSIEYKQDYKQSYARRGAQDGQLKHEEPEKGEVSLRVTVTDYTLEQVGGRDLRLRSDRSVLCTVDASYAELLTVGSRIRIRGKIYCFSAASNPGQFDSLLYYKTLGYDFRLLRTEVTALSAGTGDPVGSLLQTGRRTLSRALDRLVPEQRYAGVLKAMLLGEKGWLDPQTKDLYQGAGIIAILTISGLHISILGAGLFKTLTRLRIPVPAAALLSLGLIFLYGRMTGMTSSAVRAIIMFAMNLAARLVHRTYDLLTAVSVASILLLAEQPLYILSSGFLFSFGSVLAVGILLPAMPEQRIPVLSSLEKGLIFPLAGLPIYLNYYFTFPLYSICTNLIVTPLMLLVMISALLSLCFALPALTIGTASAAGAFLLAAAGLCVLPARVILVLYELVCKGTRLLPGYTMVLGCPAGWQTVFYLFMLAFLAVGSSSIPSGIKRIWLLLAVTVITARYSAGLTLSFIDVGQGDGIYLEADGTRILIDGGSSSQTMVGTYTLIPFLQHEGVRRLDSIILTHEDDDHMSGMLEILEGIPDHGISVGCLILPDIAEEIKGENYRKLEETARQKNVSVSYISRGDEIRSGRLIMECLHPEAGEFCSEANEYSTTLYVRYGSFTAILNGDLEKDGEEKCLAYMKTRTDLFDPDGNNRVTVLKAGHHGSRFATGEAWLSFWKPDTAVISCGRHNSYGHPSPEVLDRLEEEGALLLDTPSCGCITCRTDGRGVKIETFLRE